MDSFIVEIIEKESFDKFTLSEFRDSYMNLSNIKCPIEARKRVYKQVLRLTQRGILIKEGKKNTHDAKYSKTDLFKKICFIKKVPIDKLNQGAMKVEIDKVNNDLSISNLEKQLYEYKVDMMSAIGESEEYIKLSKQFPKQKNILKEKYDLSRDQSSKLLGQIKAIKTMISIQAGQ